MENPTYLGDAVYGYFDGFGVELRLYSHEAPKSVYLEPEVFSALLKFWHATHSQPTEVPEAIQIAVAERKARQEKELEFFLRASLVMNKFPEHLRDRPTIFADDITMFSATREEVVEIMATLKAGRWEREVSPNDPSKLNYTGTVDGVPVMLFGCEPPPSCKIVEVEEEVPAHVRKVRKLVCKEASE